MRPSPWSAFVTRKVGTWVPGDLSAWTWNDDLERRVKGILGKVSLRVSSAVTKSWANAWTTSSRMHEEERLPCIFGCADCDDELAHYICCDPLWTAAISNSYSSVELLHRSPLERLCLIDPHVEDACLLALTFNCYHAVKLANREIVDKCVQVGDFSAIQDKLMSLADAFKKDLAI